MQQNEVMGNSMVDEKKIARDAAKQDVKLYMANDWHLKEETPEYFLLTRSESSMTGHILIFLFFGWWTFGVANLIYYLAKKKSKRIIK